MKIRTILPFALILALLTGCAEDEATTLNVDGGEPMAFCIAQDAQTRAVNLAGNDWEGGEEVAVKVDGVMKKYVVDATDHSKLSPAPGVEPFYWSSNTETKTVEAWYPYTPYRTTKPDVTVRDDQSTEAKLRSAIMLEATVTDAPFGPVALTFTHRTAKVSVMAHDDNGDSYDSDLILLTNLSGVSNGTSVKMYKRPVSGGYLFEALVAPQTIAANTSLVTICKGSDVWTYKHNAAVSLQAGGMESIVINYNSATRPALNGHKYVEMGDGLKWATCNVGATTPQDYGNYFAWGETATKDNYSWSTYAFNPSGDGDTMTKYTTTNAQLEAEDDAATANWGGTWRMPTDAEWTWLRTNCTWTWTNNYLGTRVKGMLVTSNVSGYTGNSIFLPAAGDGEGVDIKYAGSIGFYYSSTQNDTYKTFAEYVWFQSDGVYRAGDSRRYGCSVRPVSN